MNVILFNTASSLFYWEKPTDLSNHEERIFSRCNFNPFSSSFQTPETASLTGAIQTGLKWAGLAAPHAFKRDNSDPVSNTSPPPSLCFSLRKFLGLPEAVEEVIVVDADDSEEQRRRSRRRSSSLSRSPSNRASLNSNGSSSVATDVVMMDSSEGPIIDLEAPSRRAARYAKRASLAPGDEDGMKD